MIRFLLLIGLLLLHLIVFSQIRLSVSTPLLPDINLNEKKREFRKEFKQVRKDSLATLEEQIRQLEQRIEQLERMDSTSFLLDSTFFQVDTTHMNPDSLFRTLHKNEYSKQRLTEELDSVSALKRLIRWDSMKDQYVARRMQELFQSKGYLPQPVTSADPVGDLKRSLQSNLPSMHLDPESFKNKEALSKEAAKQLGKLKKRYMKVDDTRYPEKGIEKPKPYSNFTDRLIFGGQINIAISKNPSLDLKPNIGVIVSRRVRVLVDYSASYFVKPELTFLERNSDTAEKLGLFTDVDITRGFFVRGKLEKALALPVKSTKDLDYLLGVGKTLTLHKNLKAQVVLTHAFTPNENGKRWFLEYGIQQQGISNLFKKKDK